MPVSHLSHASPPPAASYIGRDQGNSASQPPSKNAALDQDPGAPIGASNVNPNLTGYQSVAVTADGSQTNGGVTVTQYSIVDATYRGNNTDITRQTGTAISAGGGTSLAPSSSGDTSYQLSDRLAAYRAAETLPSANQAPAKVPSVALSTTEGLSPPPASTAADQSAAQAPSPAAASLSAGAPASQNPSSLPASADTTTAGSSASLFTTIRPAATGSNASATEDAAGAALPASSASQNASPPSTASSSQTAAAASSSTPSDLAGAYTSVASIGSSTIRGIGINLVA